MKVIRSSIFKHSDCYLVDLAQLITSLLAHGDFPRHLGPSHYSSCQSLSSSLSPGLCQWNASKERTPHLVNTSHHHRELDLVFFITARLLVVFRSVAPAHPWVTSSRTATFLQVPVNNAVGRMIYLVHPSVI